MCLETSGSCPGSSVDRVVTASLPAHGTTDPCTDQGADSNSPYVRHERSRDNGSSGCNVPSTPRTTLFYYHDASFHFSSPSAFQHLYENCANFRKLTFQSFASFTHQPLGIACDFHIVKTETIYTTDPDTGLGAYSNSPYEGRGSSRDNGSFHHETDEASKFPNIPHTMIQTCSVLFS